VQKTVAIVANSTWNIYNFRFNIIKMLEELHFKVIVIAPVDEYIYYLTNRKNTRHIPLHHLSRKGTMPLNNIQLFNELYQIYKVEKPDLILHFTIKPNIFGNLAAKVVGIPSICVVTGLGYSFLNHTSLKSISNFLYKFSFKYASKVIFENQTDKTLFDELSITKPLQSLAIKGCGVNTSYYKPKSNAYQKTKIFTFIGRLLYDKGIVEFVEAARLVKKDDPEARFWVIGELDRQNPSSVSEDLLSDWIENGDIEYWGMTEDIRPFVHESDAIVLPSYREGMPRVILEAMSMGKIVVSTMTAGCDETIEHDKNGYLVPVKDSIMLSEVIKIILDMNELELQKMGIYSRKKALNEFDIKIITEQYMQIIHKQLNLPYRSPDLRRKYEF
jgi:glycosyltransferase involved in cell wall biosynthesis